MKKTPWLLLAICASVVIVWLGSWLWIVRIFPLPKESEKIAEVYALRGQFGDMFGAVNALFSGLAFAGVLYTLWIQQKEIEGQREESKKNDAFRNLQIDALYGSLKAQNEQLELLKQQGLPVFDWQGILSPRSSETAYPFENKGGRCKITELKILTPLNVTGRFEPHGVIGPGQKGKFSFCGPPGSDLAAANIKFEVIFQDAQGTKDWLVFNIEPGKQPAEVR